MKEKITDPIDWAIYEVTQIRDSIGDASYKKVLEALKRARHKGHGTHYVKIHKQHWETVAAMWEQYKLSDLPMREIYRLISTAVGMSERGVQLIITRIRKNDAKTLSEIDPTRLFEYWEIAPDENS